MTATPDANYHFVSWSDGYPTAARTDLNVTANKSVTANFAIDTYTLTYTAGANGSIVGTTPQTVNHGADGTLVTATPAVGYHFLSWSDGYPTAARTDLNVTANNSVTANFEINSAAKAITAFSFASPAATGVINETNHTIAVSVPTGTNVTALVASFTTTGESVAVGATAQVSGTTPNDFTSPVIYTVTAADTSTQDYTVTVTVMADQATLTAVATPSTVAYGSTSALSTTGGSGTGAVTFSVGASTGCSVSGSTLSVTDPNGSCAVTATKAADASYNAATSAALPVTLTKAVLTVTANNQTISFGSPDPAFTFAYSGFVNSENATALTTEPTCTVSGAHTAVGTYPIVCAGGVAANYSFNYVNGTLTVSAVSSPVNAYIGGNTGWIVFPDPVKAPDRTMQAWIAVQ